MQIENLYVSSFPMFVKLFLIVCIENSWQKNTIVKFYNNICNCDTDKEIKACESMWRAPE